MPVIVFDMGGTLMQYTGMPHTWTAFYERGFRAVAQKIKAPMMDDWVQTAVERLEAYNPRVNYREIEYAPEDIFADVLQNDTRGLSIDECIQTFWIGLRLNAEVFADTWQIMRVLRTKGYQIAVLTDLPSAMPDELFRRDVVDLLTHIDCYVSSAIAGYRKPNPHGLRLIAKRFGVPVSELVFVGDEAKDEQTALNAGCRFVRISRDQDRAGCIRDLMQLQDILE